jgi:hypothetical protein
MNEVVAEAMKNMQLFNQDGGSGVIKSGDLSRQDKINLIKSGACKGLLDPETEAKLLLNEPKLDIELNDPLKANTVCFKFLAFKSPYKLESDIVIPKKLFLSFKFFTFKNFETENVNLKLSGEESKPPSVPIGTSSDSRSKLAY